ncbi:hypothetical protein VTN77DRAFT_1417 [Rasamsonia byssochlamydoides]|uniref:uncharacterized protein n=1 Tax=Rasamsonia byssochlamydoides TaxID=89139 RepID=UPI0037436CBD
MLLTLKPPIQNGIKGPHEYSVIRQSLPAPQSSSTPTASAKPSPDRAMDNPRRGLPPPSAMTLAPEPTLPAVTPMNQFPPPPPQWPGWEESMRQWLQAKAEEDRRRQEEERTRQEGLRLEQRKVEQSMLRDSFQAGVPPHMVPLIFAGLGGGNLPRAALDIIQQLVDQTSSQSQPLQHQRPPPPSSQLAPPPPPPPPPSSQPQPPTPSHALPRDSRAIPPNPYAAQAGAPLPAPPPPQAVPPSPPQQPYGPSQQPLLHPPSADPRAPPPPSSTLSRINTAEMHIHHPPANVGAGQYQPAAAAPPPPAAPVKPETQSQQSPSIYFHHWVPPGQSQPNTPSGRGQQESTPSSNSHLRSEFQSSPGRKRKAQGPHQPAPPPSSQPTESSPAMSQSPRHATPVRRGPGQGHLRQRSDASYESRYQEFQESDPAHARRASGGPGSETQPGSGEREERTSAPQSRYGEPQSSSQPGGYGGYHHSHDSGSRQ